MATQESIDSQIRVVTDEEVDFFLENGWVTLRGLFSPSLAADMLARVQAHMGVHGDADPISGIDSQWQDWARPSEHDPLLAQAVHSPQVGRSCARLLIGDGPIRYLDDRMLVKLPIGRNPERGQPTVYHQDWNNRPFDSNALAVWVALDEVTPEQASLRFLSGSHKLGPAGHWFLPIEAARERVPILRRFELSEPPHLMPGDATIHGSYTIHGATANNGNSPRWGYRLAYFPGNAKHVKLPSIYTDELGFEQWQGFDHPNFPLVYDPAG